MNLISRIWAGLASLAGNVEALSATFAEANVTVRQSLGLPQQPTPALPDAPADDEAAPKKGRKAAAA